MPHTSAGRTRGRRRATRWPGSITWSPGLISATATRKRTSTMSTDKLLFTPGPLTTSATVKAAMLHDAGSRDAEFIAAVRDIRERLLRIGGAAPGGGYECVPMQGSGTFAIEAVISSAIPRDGRLLVLVNGAYGRRIVEMARVHGIEVETVEAPENRKISPEAVAERLAGTVGRTVGLPTHVAVIHCET